MPPSPSLQLPEPSADALAHSARLRAELAGRIQAQGGWMDFAGFMDGLLYAPGLGYYAAGAARFNAAGDFTTAPETSPLFGRTLARAIAPALRNLTDPVLLEPGAGSGRLAATLLPALAALDALPQRYAILEPSPSLRAEQRAALASLPDDLARRVVWLDDLPARLHGVVVANEVLDAMPVHLLRYTGSGGTATAPETGAALSLHERGVALDAEGAFRWEERPARAELVATAGRLLAAARPAVGNLFELSPAAAAWARELAGRLDEGLLVLIDYGYPRRELFHPQRRHGTLMCHYRHHAHHDPFHLPGLEDVTAHVDFSAIAGVLIDAGLVLHDFESQGSWLLKQGLLDVAQSGADYGSLDWLRQSRDLQTLVHPSEMGESFKVLAALRDPHRRLAGSLPGAGHLASCSRLGLTPERA